MKNSASKQGVLDDVVAGVNWAIIKHYNNWCLRKLYRPFRPVLWWLLQRTTVTPQHSCAYPSGVSSLLRTVAAAEQS